MIRRWLIRNILHPNIADKEYKDQDWHHYVVASNFKQRILLVIPLERDERGTLYDQLHQYDAGKAVGPLIEADPAARLRDSSWLEEHAISEQAQDYAPDEKDWVKWDFELLPHQKSLFFLLSHLIQVIFIEDRITHIARSIALLRTHCLSAGAFFQHSLWSL